MIAYKLESSMLAVLIVFGLQGLHSLYKQSFLLVGLNVGYEPEMMPSCGGLQALVGTHPTFVIDLMKYLTWRQLG